MLFLLFCTTLSDTYDNLNTSFSNSPISSIFGLTLIKGEKSGKKCFRDHFSNLRQMNNSFLLDFKASILTKWQKLQSNKLLTKRLTKNLTHITKELYSDNPIILIGIIMCHLNNMSQYEITSLTIIDLMC